MLKVNACIHYHGQINYKQLIPRKKTVMKKFVEKAGCLNKSFEKKWKLIKVHLNSLNKI